MAMNSNCFLYGIVLIVFLVVQRTLSIQVPVRPISEKPEEQPPVFGNPLEGKTTEEVDQNVKTHVNNQIMRYNQEKHRQQRVQARKLQAMVKEQNDTYMKEFQQQDKIQSELEKRIMKEREQHRKQEKGTARNKTSLSRPHKRRTNKKGDTNVTDSNVESKITFDFSKNPWLRTLEISRIKRLDKDNPETRRTDNPTAEIYSDYFLPVQHSQRAHERVIDEQQYFLPTQRPQFDNGRNDEFPQTNGDHERISYNFAPAGEVSSLTSEALSNGRQNLYSQLNAYSNNEGIESSLTALLGKQPDDQLKGLNRLLQQNNANHKLTSEDLRNTNINIKASSLDVPVEYYKKYEYVYPSQVAQNSYQPYLYGYDTKYPENTKQYTPITESVEDIADTRRPPKIVPVRPTYTYVTETPSTKSSAESYYKVEVGSHVTNNVPKKGGSSLSSPTNSYTSGHDNVSIEVKDNINHTNMDIRGHKNRFKQKNKITNNNYQHGLNIESENMFKVQNTRIPFGTKLKPKGKLNRTKRQIGSKVNSSYFMSKSLSPVSQLTNINTTPPTKLKTFLVNSYHSQSNVNIPLNVIRNISNQVNCTECFKVNDESEFYYYDDDGNSTETQTDEDFPSYDDWQYNSTTLNKKKLTLKSLDHSGDNGPHTEALRYGIMRRPKLYRLLNGVRSRVMRPNPMRFKKYLIKMPIRDYVYNRYGNPLYMDDSYSTYHPRGHSSPYSQINIPSGHADENINESLDDEYYDESEDFDSDDDDLGIYRYGPDNYGSQSSPGQYAAGYNYNDYNDFIGSDNQFTNRNVRFRNHMIPSAYSNRGRERYRYASSYGSNEDYINDDVYNDYTRNVRNQYRIPARGHSFDYDYTKDNLDNDEYSDLSEPSPINYNRQNYRYQPVAQESVYNKLYANKDFSDPHASYYDSSNVNRGNKNLKDPSNYYVENFNQYVSKPNNGHGGYETRHQKPVSVFNIFRTDAVKKPRSFHHQLHDEHGDVIHIDNLNVFPHGPAKGPWKGSRKPPHHLPYRRHRPLRFKRKRPIKWKRPRLHRRTNPTKKHMQHLQKIAKLNQMFHYE